MIILKILVQSLILIISLQFMYVSLVEIKSKRRPKWLPIVTLVTGIIGFIYSFGVYFID